MCPRPGQLSLPRPPHCPDRDPVTLALCTRYLCITRSTSSPLSATCLPQASPAELTCPLQPVTAGALSDEQAAPEMSSGCRGNMQSTGTRTRSVGLWEHPSLYNITDPHRLYKQAVALLLERLNFSSYRLMASEVQIISKTLFA